MLLKLKGTEKRLSDSMYGTDRSLAHLAELYGRTNDAKTTLEDAFSKTVSETGEAASKNLVTGVVAACSAIHAAEGELKKLNTLLDHPPK